MDVNAVAGSHIDQILQARAVPRYLMRVVCLDSGDQALLGRRDLYVQLLNHERHLLPRAGIAGSCAGQLDSGPANAARRGVLSPHRPQALQQLRW
jgi:hypothetical protein